MEGKGKGETAELKAQTATCGLVMPIGALDGCSVEHWAEIKAILTEAIESVTDPKFSVKLVSDADDIGIIQKRIVQNVYTSDILVCDVSGKNPNVMFELGMRLAFDKPVVIVKDDKTDYSFDTGVIEHVGYPRDLRFAKIVDFKKLLATKVVGTHKAASKPEHSPFLKNFGKFHVANLEETTVTPDRMVLELVEEIRRDVGRMQRKLDGQGLNVKGGLGGLGGLSSEFVALFRDAAAKFIEKEKLPDARALLGNEEFYNFVEGSCFAPKYFPSIREFRITVDALLRDYPRIELGHGFL